VNSIPGRLLQSNFSRRLFSDLGKKIPPHGMLAKTVLFAFGRLQSSLPKALESLFDPPHPTPPDFIEIGYSKVSYDTFLD
jgi:hypothetical protein